MKQNIADILKDALKLPPEARAALAGTLLDSRARHGKLNIRRFEKYYGRLARNSAARCTDSMICS